jgi:hypothetical protein
VAALRRWQADEDALTQAQAAARDAAVRLFNRRENGRRINEVTAGILTSSLDSSIPIDCKPI